MAEVKPPKTLVEPITSVEFSVALRVVAGVKALMRSDLANLEIGAKLSLYQLAPHEVEMFARSGSDEVGERARETLTSQTSQLTEGQRIDLEQLASITGR